MRLVIDLNPEEAEILRDSPWMRHYEWSATGHGEILEGRIQNGGIMGHVVGSFEEYEEAQVTAAIYNAVRRALHKNPSVVGWMNRESG